MITTYEILLRLVIASIFGALIGLERERIDWAAGMRTHMMVSVGACLIMIVSAFGFSDILGTDNVDLDPSRVAAQVVSGIGFIGAGAILFLKQGTVRGLTTAAGLWTVAAIGLATGGGMYVAAAATTAIALVILWALHPLERRFSKRFNHISLKVVTGISEEDYEVANNLTTDKDIQIQSFRIEKYSDHLSCHYKLRCRDVEVLNALKNELKHNPKIKEFVWAQ